MKREVRQLSASITKSKEQQKGIQRRRIRTFKEQKEVIGQNREIEKRNLNRKKH